MASCLRTMVMLSGKTQIYERTQALNASTKRYFPTQAQNASTNGGDASRVGESAAVI